MGIFTSSDWDRRIEPILGAASRGRPMPLSLAQYKRAIARDLEVLLNTGVAIPAEELESCPACRESIVNFGLADFAQPYLTSSENRKEVYDRLMAAITRHEPRLTQVRARLVEEEGTVNRLSFVVFGQLRALADDERVQFDLMLEPSSLHYSIR